jgi:hypothetical protein
MKTESSTPLTNASKLSTANGLIQEMLGSTALGPASPAATLTRATTAKMPSVISSALRRPTWVRAESSMPITQIAVMIAIHTTPTAVTAAVELAALSQSKSRKLYRPAIWARLAITMTSATMIAQPPIQPAHGPIALLTQVNVVPQSGLARFM